MWLYKMTNKLNGKVYIGATVRAVLRRIQSHNAAAKRGKTTLVAEAIREFGITAFSIEVLGNAESREQLAQMEIEAIRRYDSLAPNGYNRTIGGERSRPRAGFHLSPEHREKISLSERGKFVSEETRRKISLARAGVKRSPLSAETKAKIRASLLGHSVSEHTRQKISERIKQLYAEKESHEKSD